MRTQSKDTKSFDQCGKLSKCRLGNTSLPILGEVHDNLIQGTQFTITEIVVNRFYMNSIASPLLFVLVYIKETG